MQDSSSSPQPATRHAVTLIEGDGVGPEIMAAVRRVLDAAGVAIDWEPAEAGARVFNAGVASGVPQPTLDSLARNKVALKGPLETPVGHGGKSANVTLRKVFETFGNVRPVRELPGVQTPFSGRGVDLVVVRENVEDLYAGIEHTQTPDVAQCLKLISTKGCEKVSRLAFEVARAENRGVVHVATKANIMKKTEGMMKREFEAAATDYPDLEARHILIDNCAHQLVIRPEQFDVILTTNMNGDILSDLTSGLVGGLGLAPSANIGHDCAIFEAVHGSAPDIAGQDKVNPTALLLSAVLLLRHLGEFSAADTVETALFKTLADGEALPADIAAGRPVAGTRAFTDAVIANLGQPTPHHEPRAYRPLVIPARSGRVKRDTPATAEVVGLDVFTEMDAPPATVGRLLDRAAEGTPYRLKMISNRGTMVYPDRGAGTDCVDHWRCRFIQRQGPVPEPRLLGIEALLRRIEATGMRWMHIEKLHRYDGEDAFTKAQGED
ncbi:MAG: NADP-dependent isocitrate dehydrogenase [Opitutales bacterium]